MLRKVSGVVAALVVALALSVGAYAGDKAETVKGKVSVVKAEDGAATVTVKAGDVVYTVAGDKAKDVEGMDGKDVEVTGKVEDKDGKKTIVVESVKAAGAAAAAE